MIFVLVLALAATIIWAFGATLIHKEDVKKHKELQADKDDLERELRGNGQVVEVGTVRGETFRYKKVDSTTEEKSFLTLRCYDEEIIAKIPITEVSYFHVVQCVEKEGD